MGGGRGGVVREGAYNGEEGEGEWLGKVHTMGRRERGSG